MKTIAEIDDKIALLDKKRRYHYLALGVFFLLMFSGTIIRAFSPVSEYKLALQGFVNVSSKNTAPTGGPVAITPIQKPSLVPYIAGIIIILIPYAGLLFIIAPRFRIVRERKKLLKSFRYVRKFLEQGEKEDKILSRLDSAIIERNRQKESWLKKYNWVPLFILGLFIFAYYLEPWELWKQELQLAILETTYFLLLVTPVLALLLLNRNEKKERDALVEVLTWVVAEQGDITNEDTAAAESTEIPGPLA